MTNLIKEPGMKIQRAVGKQKVWFILKNNAGWQGPYPTKGEAQVEAAKALAREPGWEQYFVVELVGTVSKPIPDMTWTEPDTTEVP